MPLMRMPGDLRMPGCFSSATAPRPCGNVWNLGRRINEHLFYVLMAQKGYGKKQFYLYAGTYETLAINKLINHFGKSKSKVFINKKRPQKHRLTIITLDNSTA